MDLGYKSPALGWVQLAAAAMEGALVCPGQGCYKIRLMKVILKKDLAEKRRVFTGKISEDLGDMLESVFTVSNT